MIGFAIMVHVSLHRMSFIKIKAILMTRKHANIRL